MSGVPSRPVLKLAPGEEGNWALADAIDRYNAQRDIVKKLRDKWKRLKCPVTSDGGSTGKAMVIHPLLKEIQDAEVLADRFMARCLEKRKPGRPAGSQSAPDRQPTASPRIRKVA